MKIIKNYTYLFIFFLLIGFALRFINNFDQMYWLDEAYTLYLSDPSIPLNDLLKKIFKIDDNPPIYFFILRMFNIFSYTPENIRLSSIIFSILSLLISIKFYENFLSKEESFYAFLLLTFNIFLIWQSKEARISSSVLFLSLVNLNIFFSYIKYNSKLYSLLLLFINLLSLSYYPFLITIIFAQTIFVFLHCKKKYLDYFTLTIISLILFFLLNYDYLISNISKTSHIGVFEFKFFINYFFKSFFGSIFLGGISLLIFAFGLINIILKKEKNSLVIFNIYLIIVTYSFIILYSYFKAGIMVPRYFIFIIPSIILIIIKTLYQYKLLKYFYLFLTVANTFILFDNFKIQKPKVSYLLNNIDTNLTKNFYINEDKFMDRYFIRSKLISKNLTYVRKKDLQSLNQFFFICLNHAEMHVGKNKNIQSNDKCEVKFNNYSLITNKNIKDFRVIYFEKN